MIWWWGSDLQVVGGGDGGFGLLYILCFGCGGLQFVVIVVVGGVTVVERGHVDTQFCNLHLTSNGG